MRKKTSHPILAIDPGLRELGYAVLDRRRVLTAGVLSLRHVARGRRAAEVRLAVQAWTRAYRPRTLVLEQTPKHPGALAPVHRLGLRLGRLGTQLRMEVATYSPRSVRQSVLGYGWATKQEVAEAIAARIPALRVHLSQNRKWKERYWQNMYDAVALALHHQLINPPSRSRRSG